MTHHRHTPLLLILLPALALCVACGGRARYSEARADLGPADLGPDHDLKDLATPDKPRTDAKAPDGPRPDLPRPDIKGHDAKPDAPHPDAPKPDLHPLKPEGGVDQQLSDSGPLAPGTWVQVPKGNFTMGSQTSEGCRHKGGAGSGKESPHKVTLTRPLEIMATEVTQGEFKLQMGYFNGALPKAPNYPEHFVTWHEAAKFCDKLTQIANATLVKQGKKQLTHCYTDKGKSLPCSGNGVCQAAASQAAICVPRAGTTKVCMDLLSAPVPDIYACTGYRLPTEAEWEYAYRAGTQTALYKTPKVSGLIANCTGKDNTAGLIGWYKGNVGVNTTSQVKGREPNAWGLYDMPGNVNEWTHDGFKADLTTAADTDPVTKASIIPGSKMVIRGGSAISEPHALRGAYRFSMSHAGRNWTTGFRCARSFN